MSYRLMSGERIREIFPGVFTFTLMTPAECKRFLEMVVKQKSPRETPNSMNKYGTVIGGGFRKFLSHLVVHKCSPIAENFFPEIKILKNSPYAFVVDYAMSTQRSLDTHVDESDVTLNVCLGHKFTGGELVVFGKNKSLEIKQKVGQAIVHRGTLLHRAKPLKSGTRSNLILWCSAKKR